MNYSKIRSLYIVAYTMCMILTLIALCTGVIFIVSSNNDTMLEKEINNTPITTSMYYTTTMASTTTTTNVITTTTETNTTTELTTTTETNTTTELTTTTEEYIYTEEEIIKEEIIEEEIPDENYTSDGTHYGTFEATYYEGGVGTYGAAGTDLISGYSIASNIFPLGSLIRIEGSGLDGIYRVDDRGGMANNVLDFYYQYGDTPSDFQFYGRMDVEVYLVS
jgi:hypothetical protein